MLTRTYEEEVCSIARALEVVGDRWTLLIVRDAFLGLKRFHEFEADLRVPKKVLTERLQRLVDEDILERRLYQERPERHEYLLTEKGRGLWRVLAHLLMWGDQHYTDDAGPPRILRHQGCGGRLDYSLRCKKCGAEIKDSRHVHIAPGPGLRAVA
ncbi:MAG TPA: helix-turn-helix domain-containing protein [Thermoleophilaceae bacterium]